eukprot:2577039-Rhodomonas_salina.2
MVSYLRDGALTPTNNPTMMRSHSSAILAARQKGLCRVSSFLNKEVSKRKQELFSRHKKRQNNKETEQKDKEIHRKIRTTKRLNDEKVFQEGGFALLSYQAHAARTHSRSSVRRPHSVQPDNDYSLFFSGLRPVGEALSYEVDSDWPTSEGSGHTPPNRPLSASQLHSFGRDSHRREAEPNHRHGHNDEPIRSLDFDSHERHDRRPASAASSVVDAGEREREAHLSRRPGELRYLPTRPICEDWY